MSRRPPAASPPPNMIARFRIESHTMLCDERGGGDTSGSNVAVISRELASTNVHDSVPLQPLQLPSWLPCADVAVSVIEVPAGNVAVQSGSHAMPAGSETMV